jgi:uncharacterized SAM-binding protein YcdF (DUF218 family)
VSVLEPLKWIGGPAFVFVLAAVCGAALLAGYVWPRWRRAAWLVVGAVLGPSVILSLPVVAHGIAARLPGVVQASVSSGSIDTLIVFDGDNRRGRLREGLRVWTESAPRQVIVSAVSQWLPEHLVEAGIPAGRLRQDDSSSNTREQVEWAARYAEAHPYERLALVASALQMPRVAALARADGLHAALLPSPVDVEPARAGWRRWVPTYAALRLSRDAFYELMALEYYERQGWTGR